MIGYRYAVGGRTRAPLRRQGLNSAPAIAGKVRLARALNNSGLAQVLIAMMLIATSGILYMAQAGQASVAEMNIADLQYDQTRLNVDNANLHATVTTLGSMGRITTVATNELHMSRPTVSGAVWIKPIVPIVFTPPPTGSESIQAKRRSRPLARIDSFLRSVWQSL